MNAQRKVRGIAEPPGVFDEAVLEAVRRYIFKRDRTSYLAGPRDPLQDRLVPDIATRAWTFATELS